MEWVQRDPKMIRGTEQPSHQNWLRELELFSKKKTTLQGDLIKAFQYLKGVNKKDGWEQSFLETRSSGFQLKEGRFRGGRLKQGIRNKFLRIRMVNRLSREVSLSWEHSRSG